MMESAVLAEQLQQFSALRTPARPFAVPLVNELRKGLCFGPRPAAGGLAGLDGQLLGATPLVQGDAELGQNASMGEVCGGWLRLAVGACFGWGQ
jgi:hypothetical protein